MPRSSKRRRLVDPTPDVTAWQTIVAALQDIEAAPSVSGWAEPPWKAWLNAVKLCHRLWQLHRTGKNLPYEVLAVSTMFEGVFVGDVDLDYWEITEHRQLLGHTYNDRPASVALETALAIAQLGASRSDGGGAAFQDRLAYTFAQFVAADIDISKAVLHMRTVDALGADADPKRVAAFKAAWELGRYKLAYLV